MATPAKRVREVGRISQRIRKRRFANLPDSLSKTLRSDFLKNVNAIGIEDYKAGNMATERADVGLPDLKGQEHLHPLWGKARSLVFPSSSSGKLHENRDQFPTT